MSSIVVLVHLLLGYLSLFVADAFQNRNKTPRCPPPSGVFGGRARLDSEDFEKQREWRVELPNEATERIEDFLKSAAPEFFPSATSVKNVLRKGLCQLNGSPAKVTDVVRTGDVICTYCRTRSPHRLVGSAPTTVATSQLQVLWEDDYLAVVDKPQGMPVFPTPGTPPGHSAYSLLLPLLSPPEKNSPLLRPQPVHRLDKETGGLILVAKTRPALVCSSLLFSQRKIVKRYTALCHGGFDVETPRSGSVREPLGGQEALTDYCLERQVRMATATLSVVSLQLHTGRTHQIRRHMDMIQRPVVGDKDYYLNTGGRVPRKASIVPFVECLPYHCLWATEMCFQHPFTNEEVLVKMDVSQRVEQCLSLIAHL